MRDLMTHSEAPCREYRHDWSYGWIILLYSIYSLNKYHESVEMPAFTQSTSEDKTDNPADSYSKVIFLSYYRSAETHFERNDEFFFK